MPLRRITLLVVVLLVASAGDAAAQTRTATGEARINVMVSLTLAKHSAIDFGAVFNNGQQTVVLSPGDGLITGGNSPQGGSSVGKFVATGQQNTSITVTFDNSVTLTGPTESGNLTFTPDVKGASTDNGGTAGSGAAGVASGNTVTTNGSGYYYFWVGGEVPIPGGQQQGEYSGTFTINVEYQSL